MSNESMSTANQTENKTVGERKRKIRVSLTYDEKFRVFFPILKGIKDDMGGCNIVLDKETKEELSKNEGFIAWYKSIKKDFTDRSYGFSSSLDKSQFRQLKELGMQSMEFKDNGKLEVYLAMKMIRGSSNNNPINSEEKETVQSFKRLLCVIKTKQPSIDESKKRAFDDLHFPIRHLLKAGDANEYCIYQQSVSRMCQEYEDDMTKEAPQSDSGNKNTPFSFISVGHGIDRVTNSSSLSDGTNGSDKSNVQISTQSTPDILEKIGEPSRIVANDDKVEVSNDTSKTAFENLSFKELKILCKQNNLAANGSRAAIINRLKINDNN